MLKQQLANGATMHELGMSAWQQQYCCYTPPTFSLSLIGGKLGHELHLRGASLCKEGVLCLTSLGGRPRLATPHPQGVPKQVGVLPWEATRIVAISLAGHMLGGHACWTLARRASLLLPKHRVSQGPAFWKVCVGHGDHADSAVHGAAQLLFWGAKRKTELFLEFWDFCSKLLEFLGFLGL